MLVVAITLIAVALSAQPGDATAEQPADATIDSMPESYQRFDLPLDAQAMFEYASDAVEQDPADWDAWHALGVTHAHFGGTPRRSPPSTA